MRVYRVVGCLVVELRNERRRVRGKALVDPTPVPVVAGDNISLQQRKRATHRVATTSSTRYRALMAMLARHLQQVVRTRSMSHTLPAKQATATAVWHTGSTTLRQTNTLHSQTSRRIHTTRITRITIRITEATIRTITNITTTALLITTHPHITAVITRINTLSWTTSHLMPVHRTASVQEVRAAGLGHIPSLASLEVSLSDKSLFFSHSLLATPAFQISRFAP